MWGLPVYEKPRFTARSGKAGEKASKIPRLGRAELILAHSANRAAPIIGQLVEGNIVMFGGIIFIATDGANILLH